MRVVSDPKVNRSISEVEAKRLVVQFVERTRRLCDDFIPFGLREVDRDFIEQGFSEAINSPIFPEFYVLPKLLKNPWQGRPIVPQINYFPNGQPNG